MIQIDPASGSAIAMFGQGSVFIGRMSSPKECYVVLEEVAPGRVCHESERPHDSPPGWADGEVPNLQDGKTRIILHFASKESLEQLFLSVKDSLDQWGT